MTDQKDYEEPTLEGSTLIDYSRINQLAEKLWQWKQRFYQEDVLNEAFQVAIRTYNPILAGEIQKHGISSVVTNQFAIKVYGNGGVGVEKVNTKDSNNLDNG